MKPGMSTQHYSKLKRLEELRKNYAMFFYKPYPKQRDFHEMGAVKRERLLMAGNRLGKCVTISTVIESPDGPHTVGELLDKGWHNVWAWDGEKKVAARAMQPFKKPAEPCFRVWMANGQWFECAGRHRLLTVSGWRFFESLLPSLPSLPPSSLGRGLITRVEDVRHLLKTPEGSPDHCFSHSYDGQLPQVPEIDRERLPLQVCVPQHNPLRLHEGVQDSIGTNNPHCELCHLSNSGALAHCEVQCVESSVSDACRLSRPNQLKPQVSQPLSIAVNLPLQSTGEAALPVLPSTLSQTLALLSPDNDGNHIIAYQAIGRHDIYDFCVPKYGNYITQGAVHHNTYAAGNEVAYHASGLYPENWKGWRFKKSTRGWVGSINAGLTKEGAQAILLGPVGHWGSGCIPKELIIEIKRARGVPDAVESVLIRHSTGEASQITFKSYEEGREAWQAATLDYVWFDEEPPEEIYIEGITRTGTTKGPCFLTFTPLLGMSNVVMRFTEGYHKDRGIVHMTIDDAGHIDAETKKVMVDSYRPHEREARAMGKPMLGSGMIFPVAEEIIREDPLPLIPPYWKQIIGLDIGYDHPTAAVRLLHDEASDCIHVVAAYRQREATPLIHAAAIRPWGSWIPVAWPHDALQHDKGGSCEQIAEQYRRLDLNMLPERACFPDKRGNGVEAGLSDMLERMQTGRFKVDSTLSQWWEEFRMYHRKDGKIIKERDDLMAATRYAMMMLRHAVPAEFAPKPRDKYAQYRHGHNETTWMAG